MTLHEKHMQLVDAVNNSHTRYEHNRTFWLLTGWKQGVEDAGGEVDRMGADLEQFDRGLEHRPMCCGVFNDWKPTCADCGEENHNGEERCDECAKLSACCGVEFDKDIRICPDCKEHC